MWPRSVSNAYVACIQNAGGYPDNRGLKIVCGNDSGTSCETLGAYDRHGDLHGGLKIAAQTVQVWQSSDGRLKESISPAEGSLEVFRGVNATAGQRL